jgi:hypothetical protein
VLFIDIEGFEFHALEGAKKLIRTKRDLLIVCEMHPNIWPSANTTCKSAERMLGELKLQPVPIQEQHDPYGDQGSVWLQQV